MVYLGRRDQNKFISGLKDLSGVKSSKHVKDGKPLKQLEVIIRSKPRKQLGLSNKLMKTSFDEGHSHTFREGDKFTSVDSDHKHAISRGRMFVERAGVNNHQHKLLIE